MHLNLLNESAQHLIKTFTLFRGKTLLTFIHIVSRGGYFFRVLETLIVARL